MTEDFNPYDTFNKVLFGITQVANIAGVTSRQLRYWESKGLIESAAEKANNSRQYSVSTTIKVITMAHFNRSGLSLEKAAQVAEGMSVQSQALGTLLSKSYRGFKEDPEGLKIFLEPIKDHPEQQIVATINDEDVSFSIDDKNQEEA